MEFRPGQALANTALWQEDIEYLKEQGIPTHKFLKTAVEKNEVCFFDSYYYNANRNSFKFNNMVYQNLEEVVNEYKGKTERQLNYAMFTIKT